MTSLPRACIHSFFLLALFLWFLLAVRTLFTAGNTVSFRVVRARTPPHQLSQGEQESLQLFFFQRFVQIGRAAREFSMFVFCFRSPVVLISAARPAGDPRLRHVQREKEPRDSGHGHPHRLPSRPNPKSTADCLPSLRFLCQTLRRTSLPGWAPFPILSLLYR